MVAGGSGQRFGELKQFALLAGRPVAQWSVEACRPAASGVVLVVPSGSGDGDHNECGADRVVEGGASRSASVRCGLAAVPDEKRYADALFPVAYQTVVGVDVTPLIARHIIAGEAMVLQNNYFIEEILPNAILRKLSDEEMAEYRRPFAEPGEGRRPTLTWPRQIPIAGEPADVHAIATEYADWLGTSNVPKLFLKAEPGAILANDTLVNLVRGWPALTEKTVAGIHFVQEDSPDEIGRAVVEWMGTLG